MFEAINQSLERRKIVTGTDCFKASDQHGKIVFKRLIIIALSSISTRMQLDQTEFRCECI